MKILMVIESDSDCNPFVSSLVDGLIKCGHEVMRGLDLFWTAYDKYDLLFFQWPEAIFNWNRDEIDIEKLSKQFERIKEAGVRTLITCHNLHPHNYDKTTTFLYDFVYSKVDAFHHMGKFSYELLKEKYPQKYHFIAPHHVAESLWENPLFSSDAKTKLSIPKNSIVVSSFGVFRNEEEIRFYVNMVKDVTNRHLVFLAPRLPVTHFYIGRHVKRIVRFLRTGLLYKLFRIRTSGYLTDEELRLWLSASDIVFIQRKEILNSGNLPLAFAGGKTVVGPDLGNVGEILRETGNFVFDPYDRASVKRAVLVAIDETGKSKGLGARNYQYAKENWSTAKVCEQISRELLMICPSC